VGESTGVEGLGTKLRLARAEAGLTQPQLARKAGVGHWTSVSAWERGENVPTLAHARALSRALGVSLDYLVGREEDR